MLFIVRQEGVWPVQSWVTTSSNVYCNFPTLKMIKLCRCLWFHVQSGATLKKLMESTIGSTGNRKAAEKK